MASQEESARTDLIKGCIGLIARNQTSREQPDRTVPDADARPA